MLQILNIYKEYKTGKLIQRALDDVTLNLRDSEFVAILGPSGSGKTTLLNIIGGLDRYDTGDVIINGTSTKKYKDRDWDSYRNHTIGFVFQSYNLIPHQTILSNVELALTISGISGRQRRKKALDALDKVGLKDQSHKKPNQLSGGQMQRVAIARALVNDPDILLADEPTGALDSDTSIHVMDLLKEVAKDRLVVMVTHNPELARDYATRIVKLSDGRIISDTDPFVPEGMDTHKAVHRNLGRASMNYLTSLSLSFNNLWTKKARTILVAFAGSIGIIGIALILSLSNGVNRYIEDTETETLSQYPIDIGSSQVSVMSLMMMPGNANEEAAESQVAGKITEIPVAGQLLSSMQTNDLQSFHDYLESGDAVASDDSEYNGTEIHDLANGIEYSYSLTPQIYYYNSDKGSYRQVNPNDDFVSMGLPSSSAMSSMYSMNVFHELPENTGLYMNQYEVMTGRWPENPSEAVLVLTDTGALSDFIVYSFGLRDADELDDMISDFVNGNSVAASSGATSTWDYDDFMGTVFKVLPAYEKYQFDDSLDVYTDMSSDDDYMMSKLAEAQNITVVGIVQPKPDADVQMLEGGVYYSADLIEDLRTKAADAPIVQAQLADRDVNILTGRRFDEENNDFDMSSLFSVDEDAMSDAFKFDEDAISFDTDSFDMGDIDVAGAFADAMPDMGSADMSQLMNGVNFKVDSAKMGQVMQALFTGYMSTLDYSASMSAYLASDAGKDLVSSQLNSIAGDCVNAALTQTDFQSCAQAVLQGFADYAAANGIVITDRATFDSAFGTYIATEAGQQAVTAQTDALKAMVIAKITITGSQKDAFTAAILGGFKQYLADNAMSTVAASQTSFAAYLAQPDVQSLLTGGTMSAINFDEISAALSANVSTMMTNVTSQLQSAMTGVLSNVTDQMSDRVADAVEDSLSNMDSAVSIDKDAFSNAITVNTDDVSMESFMSQMMNSSGQTSAESNLTDFGYCDAGDYSGITIYPKDFKCKDEIGEIIDDYNSKVKTAGDDDKVISYTDVVGTLMSSVTKIVNTISYVLIAFVAISLVVSSIMIGVITYISVLERRKEIGILRAMGASRRNIAQVFNAETAITGLLAGAIGVGLSLLILIPGNILIHYIGDTKDVSASLPPLAGVILILLSVVLTLIGGLIPSRKASNQDPVTALRTE